MKKIQLYPEGFKETLEKANNVLIAEIWNIAQIKCDKELLEILEAYSQVRKEIYDRYSQHMENMK